MARGKGVGEVLRVCRGEARRRWRNNRIYIMIVFGASFAVNVCVHGADTPDE